MAAKKTPVKPKPATPKPAAVTADQALALVKKLGLSAPEVDAIVGAKAATAAQLAEGEHANLADLAAAFSDDELAALSGTTTFVMKSVKPAVVTKAVGRTRSAASASAKLIAGADLVGASVHTDLQALVKAEHELFPQIVARAALDSDAATTWSPLVAYHHARFPGGKRKPKAPADPTKK